MRHGWTAGAGILSEALSSIASSGTRPLLDATPFNILFAVALALTVVGIGLAMWMLAGIASYQGAVEPEPPTSTQDTGVTFRVIVGSAGGLRLPLVMTQCQMTTGEVHLRYGDGSVFRESVHLPAHVAEGAERLGLVWFRTASASERKADQVRGLARVPLREIKRAVALS